MAGPAWLTARPVAHRGYHDAAAGRVENTVGALAAAAAKGFAVECDLQLTRDDVPVAFHDDTVDRLTTARGEAAAMTLAEMKALELVGSDEAVPTLDEVLGAIAGRAPLFVELKSRFDGDRRLEQIVAPILASYSGPLAVMSFDPDSMLALKRLAPALPRGLVADSFTDPAWSGLSAVKRLALRHLAAAPLAAPAFIAYGVHDLPADAPLFLRHLGVPLLTWTVRTEADRATARRYADQIIFEDFDPDAIAA